MSDSPAEPEKRPSVETEGTLANGHKGLEEKPERGVRLSWALLGGTGARFHWNCLWSENASQNYPLED